MLDTAAAASKCAAKLENVTKQLHPPVFLDDEDLWLVIAPPVSGAA